MADVKWIKIVTDVFDDEKILLIETLPEADSIIVIWFKLLCLAGKQNNSGVFIINGIPYTEKMLSAIFRRKETIVTLALKTFEEFGMVEIIDNAITIPNWGKHQNFDKIEANNEYMRSYMREYRSRQKALVEGKGECKPNRKVNSKTNRKSNVRPLEKSRVEKEKNIPPYPLSGECKKNTEQIQGEHLTVKTASGTGTLVHHAMTLEYFGDFWNAYPRKQAKGNAEKAFKRLKPDKQLLEKILSAIELAKGTSDWKRDGGRYIPLPASWLNARRWEDEPLTEAATDANPYPNALT